MPLGVLVSLTVTSIRGRLASERKVTARSGSVNEACAATLAACWRAAAAPASDLSQMDCALTSANAPCDNAKGAHAAYASVASPERVGMAEDRKPSHTVADHLLGQDVVHEHDGDADHDHDHFEFDSDERLEENPIWIQDHVTLVTVGIDIGSSGTQVIFSRINLRRYGEDLTSRYYVVSSETLFQSPVALTPYSSDERIDDAALGAIIDEAYAAAGVEAQDIDTGVVILTGEALRRENAEAIAALLAEQRGDFVTAAAGHHMESMLAAYGSGASKVSYAEDKRILNVDIGGGTTKLGIVEKGNVIATAALHIGGRLQVMEETGRIVRLDPAGKFHARQAGLSWARGDVVSSEQLDKVAANMAELLVAALTQRPLPSAVEHLYLTDPIRDLGRIDGLMFSGGVGSD